ncbi:glycosyltransferase family 4 protein [Candidatus Gracilibacteria bacterium]|nr:glycosyltransferase family 4 protein [Candidatus Gracilibacteria bacterium]
MSKNNTLSILFASRLVEEKGVDILIDCIEKIQNDPTLSDCVFWNIVSDGEYASQIEVLFQKYPKNVCYFGKVDSQKLSKLYKENDLLFMPSRFLETFGLTALESLASGTPVLGFSKGGLVSFIPDSLAIDPHNPVNDCILKIRSFLEFGIPEPISIDEFRKETWIKNLTNLFFPSQNIVILHDY